MVIVNGFLGERAGSEDRLGNGFVLGRFSGRVEGSGDFVV